MNKQVFINLELDIKRNTEYKQLQNIYKKTLQIIKNNIYNHFSSGKIAERNYNIRHDAECTKKENEYINVIAELEYKQYNEMYNKMLELKKENIAMKKALKDNNINVTIEHIKYYGENEEIAI